MTEQTAIPLPSFSPLKPIVPVVIHPSAPRCWVRFPAPLDVDRYALPVPHYASEEDLHAALGSIVRAERLLFVCVTPHCFRCRDAYADSEYGGGNHFPSWAEAERVARLDGWRIGARSEFVCPDCGEVR